MSISEDDKQLTMEECTDGNKRIRWLFENYDASKQA